MTDLYLAQWHDYDSGGVIGVYSTLELAQAACWRHESAEHTKRWRRRMLWHCPRWATPGTMHLFSVAVYGTFWRRPRQRYSYSMRGCQVDIPLREDGQDS